MEKIVERGLLYDFYGELLTDHQKRIYKDAVYNDLSLSEIADEYQISRQGVHDLIKRCNKTLQSYEDKLHLIARFQHIKDKVEQAHRMTADHTLSEKAVAEAISKLLDDILEEL